MAAQALSDEPE